MGLFGPAAPPPEPCKVACPPERHIPVPFTDIYNIVKVTMTVGQRQKYEEVCQLVESLFAQEFMSLRRNIKQNFRAFSVGAKGQDLPTRKGKSLPPKADLDMREERLVADFLQLMAAARFHLITDKEWQVAMQERFMFHLPVKVNWDYFDSKLLSSFWSSSRERSDLRAQLPEHADRILIFHRGIGVAEDRGLFITQKVDLLVEYLVVMPFLRVWAWICAVFAKLFRRKPKQLPAGTATAATVTTADATTATTTTTTATAPAPSTPAAKHTTTFNKRGVHADVVKQPITNPANQELSEEELKMLAHPAAKLVERRTIKRLLPTSWSIIKNMHKSLDLQEPMYKEVVVLYRTSGQARKTTQSKVPVRARSNTERLKDILARRNVHVKCFHDIPMADMEVIFPDKKVYMKTVSLINMVIQACTAFFAALAGLAKAGTLNLQAVWSALSLVAARCGQLYSSMQAERSNMIQNMVNILYDKTNDAQEGVISMLLEDMAEQQLKEAVLAYTMLYLNIDDELTQERLDNLCEKFLEENFEMKLDFAVEDALPNLVNWGMVRYNPKKDRYQALPVELAHRSLIQRWMIAYEALSKPPQTKTLPLGVLVGQHDDADDNISDLFHLDNQNNSTFSMPALPNFLTVETSGASTTSSITSVTKAKGLSARFKRMFKSESKASTPRTPQSAMVK